MLNTLGCRFSSFNALSFSLSFCCRRLLDSFYLNFRERRRHSFEECDIIAVMIYTKNCIKCRLNFPTNKPNRILCDTCRQVKCVVCSTDFLDGGSHNRKCCSNACRLIYQARPTLTCIQCGNTFLKRLGHVMKHCSQECRYKSARKPNAAKHRGHDYRKWVTAVFERDGFACQQCGSTGAIHAHHVKEWAEFPELRFDVANGLTLCQDCHQIIHGRKITQASKRFQPVCISCDVKTKGHSKYCRSCAIRLQKQQRRASLFRDREKHLTSSAI